MPLDKLENLVRIGQLKHEPPDQNEFDGMVASAEIRLNDAKQYTIYIILTDSAFL